MMHRPGMDSCPQRVNDRKCSYGVQSEALMKVASVRPTMDDRLIHGMVRITDLNMCGLTALESVSEEFKGYLY